MKITGALLQALLVMLALTWAGIGSAEIGGTNGGTVHTSGAVVAAATVPSIEILATQTHLAGSCSGAPFDLNTTINVDTKASADVRLVTPGLGVLEEFTDDTGSNIGPFNGVYPTFHILGFGGGLAPHTSVQLIITTYTGPAITGKSSYISAVTFDCTSGVITNLANSATDTLPPIPTASNEALAAMACMLALLGTIALRRRPKPIGDR